jgi:hypothetical protein
MDMTDVRDLRSDIAAIRSEMREINRQLERKVDRIDLKGSFINIFALLAFVVLEGLMLYIAWRL